MHQKTAARAAVAGVSKGWNHAGGFFQPGGGAAEPFRRERAAGRKR